LVYIYAPNLQANTWLRLIHSLLAKYRMIVRECHKMRYAIDNHSRAQTCKPISMKMKLICCARS
jgi:hypothetical protein